MLLYFFQTKYGFLERGIVERSGFSADDYPLAFKILYDWNTVISLYVFSGLFLITLYWWTKKDMKQYVIKTTGRFLMVLYISICGTF